MIIMCGDIHGKFDLLIEKIIDKKISDCTIIQVGDFGVGFNSNDIERMERLNSSLSERNILLLAIRGNHDDPEFFTGTFFNLWDNLKLVPDYTVLNIDGYNILFVGGALSVDRRPLQVKEFKDELKRKFWFKDEGFILDEEKLKDIKDVDIVVTHSAPEWCFPDNRLGFNDFMKYYIQYDLKLAEDSISERKNLSKMFQILEEGGNNYILRHYYGHFHRNEITINGMCLHTVVDILGLEMVPEKN